MQLGTLQVTDKPIQSMCGHYLASYALQFVGSFLLHSKFLVWGLVWSLVWGSPCDMVARVT